jgi:uncharacterized OsmC-like protein
MTLNPIYNFTACRAREPEGMSPGAMMMAALGTCVGSRLVDQMNKRGGEAEASRSR